MRREMTKAWMCKAWDNISWWHMVGDSKTLKCMYNVSNCTKSKSPCLYYMSGAKAFHRRYCKKALTNRYMTDPNFKPVLNIPLSRVHICKMHALHRIIERIVFLNICFVWTLYPSRH